MTPRPGLYRERALGAGGHGAIQRPGREKAVRLIRGKHVFACYHTSPAALAVRSSSMGSALGLGVIGRVFLSVRRACPAGGGVWVSRLRRVVG